MVKNWIRIREEKKHYFELSYFREDEETICKLNFHNLNIVYHLFCSLLCCILNNTEYVEIFVKDMDTRCPIISAKDVHAYKTVEKDCWPGSPRVITVPARDSRGPPHEKPTATLLTNVRCALFAPSGLAQHGPSLYAREYATVT